MPDTTDQAQDDAAQTNIHTRDAEGRSSDAQSAILHNRSSRISGHNERVSKINGHPSVRALLKRNPLRLQIRLELLAAPPTGGTSRVARFSAG